MEIYIVRSFNFDPKEQGKPWIERNEKNSTYMASFVNSDDAISWVEAQYSRLGQKLIPENWEHDINVNGTQQTSTPTNIQNKCYQIFVSTLQGVT